MQGDSPLPEIVEQWLSHLQYQGKSTHTIGAYQRALQHLIQWNFNHFGEDFNPASLIPRDIRDWQSYQRQVEKAAPSTINQRLAALSRFFSWAVAQKVVATNPAIDIKGIKLPNRQPKALSERDLRRLLRAVHMSGDLRDIAMIEVLVGTGVRVGELLNLTVGDIVIRERSGSLTVREGKQGNFREIPLSSEVRTALRAYLNTHPEQENPEAPLWFSGHGAMVHRSSILRILNKYSLLAQIDDFSPHKLRHTFATRYLEANPEDLRGLASLLGHSSLDTVMIYTEPTLDNLADRIERAELGRGYTSS
jgi:integrase/recombinase XerD